MDLINRLQEILKFSGLSVRAFAIKCGLSQPTLDKQLKGLRAVSIETVMAVLYVYPDISAEWLMRGTGEMIKSKPVDLNAERLLKLVDTIATLQDTINAQKDTISALNDNIKKLEAK